jgi:hypothetical protein
VSSDLAAAAGDILIAGITTVPTIDEVPKRFGT